jgi:hypothetical protein
MIERVRNLQKALHTGSRPTNVYIRIWEALKAVFPDSADSSTLSGPLPNDRCLTSSSPYLWDPNRENRQLDWPNLWWDSWPKWLWREPPTL